MGFLDVVPQLLEQPSRSLGSGDAIRVGVELSAWWRRGDTDSQAAWLCTHLFAVRARRCGSRVGVAGSRAVDRVKDSGSVTDAVGDGQLDHQPAEQLAEIGR